MLFKSWLRGFMRKLKFVVTTVKQSPLSIIGASIIIFYVIIALLAPILAPPLPDRDPFRIPRKGYSPVPKPPSPEHIFGTTEGQYDIWYGCIWGTITAFRVGFLISFGALAIGFVVGVVASHFGGIIDELVMRFTDIILALSIILAMGFLIASPSIFEFPSPYPLTIILNPMDKVLLALIIVGWPVYARITRNEILAIRQRKYARAAEAVGYSYIGVTIKHVVPDLTYPIFIMPFLGIGLFVLIAAALSFLGIGAPPGYADWGQLIALSRNYIYASISDPWKYWYTYVIPGLFLFTFVLGWILLATAFKGVLYSIKEKNNKRK